MDFFFRKTILSHFTFYAIFNIKKKKPFTYWLNGRWFLQIVERDSWNLYPLYPLFPCSDFVSHLKCGGGLGGGGGVMFFSHFMLNQHFLEKIWEYKPIISQFNVFFMFFLYFLLEILKSAPSLTATG